MEKAALSSLAVGPAIKDSLSSAWRGEEDLGRDLVAGLTRDQGQQVLNVRLEELSGAHHVSESQTGYSCEF